jgi:hypothetical protein
MPNREAIANATALPNAPPPTACIGPPTLSAPVRANVSTPSRM